MSSVEALSQGKEGWDRAGESVHQGNSTAGGQVEVRKHFQMGRVSWHSLQNSPCLLAFYQCSFGWQQGSLPDPNRRCVLRFRVRSFIWNFLKDMLDEMGGLD